jgi:drug/metabolite transporter (DMT)-like permease
MHAGVSLLTTSEGDPNWGDAVCIFSAVLFGVHKWRSETITARVADTPSLVALQLVVLAGTSVLLAVPEMAAFFSANGDAQIPAAIDALANFPWPNIFFMGVGTTALTLYIEMDSLKEVSAAMAALIYTTEPLWGAAFAWMLLDERWGTQGWIGAALIVTASFASQLSGDIEDKEESHAVKKEA